MVSIDTNILLYAQNMDCPEHEAAHAFVTEFGIREDVAICDLVLVELYLLLRNPAVMTSPVSAADAVAICDAYRANPHWRLIENAPVMDRVWRWAAKTDAGRRQIIDTRLALTLQHHGVTRFATANEKHFRDFGFEQVWNPVFDAPPETDTG